MKQIVLAILALLFISTPAFAQFTTDTDCGAAGYACLNGRHCSAGRCSPAWQDMNISSSPQGEIASNVESIDGKIAVLGGCPSSATTGDTPTSGGGLYDPVTDTWSAIASPSVPRQGGSSAAGNGGIYLFGGLTQCYWPYGLDGTLEFLSTSTGTWTTVPAANTPSPRYNAAMQWIGSDLVLFGGSDSMSPALPDGGRVSTGDWNPFTCDIGNCQRGGQYDIFPESMEGGGDGFRIWGGLSGYGNAPQAITNESNAWSESWSTPDGGPDFETDLCNPGEAGDHDGRRTYYLGAGNVVWIFDHMAGTWSVDGTDWPSSLSTCASSAWSNGELFSWSGDGVQYGARYQPPAP